MLVPSLKLCAAFDKFIYRGQNVLLITQRLRCAFEVVEAVKKGLPLGARLSGPNGVGKSAILFLVHLICTALRLPAVYIPRAESLVNAAHQEGGGDAYILKTFFEQNADLILEIPALRRVFVAALQDAGRPFTPDVMEQLRGAVGMPGLPGLAVIDSSLTRCRTSPLL